MNVRSLCLSVALLSCTSAATVIACAGDETPSGPPAEPDASTIPPPADAGADADADVEVDASEPALPCTDDVLCPFGPFESGTEGGPIAARTRINAIRARSPSDVWVVGVSGAVAHYDGTSWKRSETGSLEAMRAVWLRENDEVAIASLTSMYRHDFDAADAGVDAGPPSADGWTAVGKPLGASTSAAAIVSSAWTTPDAEWVWITSIDAYSERTRKGIWRLHVVPATNQLDLRNPLPTGTCGTQECNQMTSVHGFSPDDLWVVGYGGEILHVTEAQSTAPKFKRFDSQTWAELDAVWAASETEAWAVGGHGVVRHYTGHPYAWDVVTDVPATETLRAVWGSSPSDVWAVGDAATVLHYDGASWSRVEIAGIGNGRPDLLTVWSPAPGRVWIGGEGVFLSLGGKP